MRYTITLVVETDEAMPDFGTTMTVNPDIPTPVMCFAASSFVKMAAQAHTAPLEDTIDQIARSAVGRKVTYSERDE